MKKYQGKLEKTSSQSFRKKSKKPIDNKNNNMTQQKRVIQGKQAKKFEIVLNVHRKLMSEV